MSDEQKKLRDTILSTEYIPDDIQVLLINKSCETSINNQRTTVFKINEDWRMKIAKIAALYYIGNYSLGKHIINWAHIVPLSVIIKRSAFILMTLSINVICSYYISARLTLFENACYLLVKEYLKSYKISNRSLRNSSNPAIFESRFARI